MDKTDSKREVPPPLKKLLDMDVYMTDQFVKSCDRIVFLRSMKTHSKIFEISCHGLIWIPSWIALIWILNSKPLHQMQVNFLLGLLLDVLFLAILKAFFRRRRPAKNLQSSLEIGPDKFSFPSGHASRAVFIACFFSSISPLHMVFIPALLAWAVSVCLSRILMRKHHLLDIIVGVLLGLVEIYLISLIYLNEDTCTNLIWWLTDEKLDGGEYHV